jgi:mono/diheme cytochrome c family protein
MLEERTSVQRVNSSIMAALLTALALGACDKTPEPAPAPTHAAVAGRSDKGPLERNLDPAQVERGHAVYTQHCVECHGVSGKGLPGDWRVRDAEGKYPPPPLDDSAHVWHHPTTVLLEAIRDGSPPGEGNMPAWKGKLSEQEMQDTVAYIKSLWSDQVYRLWLKMEQQSMEQ